MKEFAIAIIYSESGRGHKSRQDALLSELVECDCVSNVDEFPEMELNIKFVIGKKYDCIIYDGSEEKLYAVLTAGKGDALLVHFSDRPFQRTYPSGEIIVNGSPAAPSMGYRGRALFLLGLEYACVRRAFEHSLDLYFAIDDDRLKRDFEILTSYSPVTAYGPTGFAVAGQMRKADIVISSGGQSLLEALMLKQKNQVLAVVRNDDELEQAQCLGVTYASANNPHLAQEVLDFTRSYFEGNKPGIHLTTLGRCVVSQIILRALKKRELEMTDDE